MVFNQLQTYFDNMGCNIVQCFVSEKFNYYKSKNNPIAVICNSLIQKYNPALHHVAR